MSFLVLFLSLGVYSMSTQTATLAGGCFWGVQEIIRTLPGVISSTVGYTGGQVDSPTYALVSQGITGHAESVQIVFDPQKIKYEDLLRYFFRLHDPTTLNQQGNDKGTQYRSEIFYHNEEQKLIAIKIKDEIEASKKWSKPIVTKLSAFTKFFNAEEYHQNYLQKNPKGYTCHWLRD